MNVPDNNSTNRPVHYLIALAVLVNFSGLFVHLMDPDAGVYASISKNILLRHDWINLYFQDKDWLDKPHLPFWITAVFFKLFGLHDWSYKLPGVLMTMVAARYTYLLALRHYGVRVALWSAFILLTSLHVLISNNDVRAEPFLMGFIIAAIYHFSLSLNKAVGLHLVVACFFTACAIMTKGLFTLAPIGGAIAGHLIITKQWQQVFHWKWIIALLLIVFFITPELYSLWIQFDRHPEKVVYGKDHVSGIRFFLWDSQFGRFTNTGPIKGKGDPFFFLHTLLWAFLPWSVLMYVAIVIRIRELKKIYGEWFTLSGTVISLLVFSISKFQLPYYTNIIFPLLAILTANIVVRAIETSNRPSRTLQNIITMVIFISSIALFLLYRPYGTIASFSCIAIIMLAGIFLSRLPGINSNALAFARSGLAVLALMLFLNVVFYPDLLRYQSGNEAAYYINRVYPGAPVRRMGMYIPSGEFYLKEPVHQLDSTAMASRSFPSNTLAILSSAELRQLKMRNMQFDSIKAFPNYHITMLKIKFLNHNTRYTELDTTYIIRLK
jgi:4-amino-4-deoxy-L-arabinose transferase-like glycosyltransferase